MNGHVLEQVEYEKDLGIIIDNELKSTTSGEGSKKSY